jgi:methionine sulfoxide reductase heme-binding subunit
MGVPAPDPFPVEEHVNHVSYWRRRILRHGALAVVSGALTVGVFLFVASESPMAGWSMASAYAALALLSVTLATGPWNVLCHRPNPVSTDLRRDIGIWAGGLGLVHVVFGLQVHMSGHMWHYFFYPPAPRRLLMRFDAFGLANYAGLGVTLILAVLLALSNDRSLRWLGTRRWKLVHRSVYVALALVVVHGALYQLTEKRSFAFVALFAALAIGVLALQLAGFCHVRLRVHQPTISTRRAERPKGRGRMGSVK